MAPQSSMTDSRASRGDDEGHHRRRHHPKFPPATYNDLTRMDMGMLAPLLLPPHPDADRSAHEKDLKKRMAALPQHLQCKHPWLSSYCGLHSKLNPLIIDSIFAAVRMEVGDELAEVWVPLKDAGKLSKMKSEMVEIQQNLAVHWLGAQVFADRYGREARKSLIVGKSKGVSKCGGCLMTSMAADFQTIVAIAGSFVGRVTEGIWQKSRRIWWFEAWVTACIVDAKRANAIQLMWDVGLAFRKARLEAKEGSTAPGEGMADAMLAGPGSAPRPTRPSRPPRLASQEGDMAFVQRQRESEASMSDAEPGDPFVDEATHPDLPAYQRYTDQSQYPEESPYLRETAQAKPEIRIASSISSRAPSIVSPERSESLKPQPKVVPRPRVASSVYSRNTMGVRDTRYEIDDIILLYRHSQILGDAFQVPGEDPGNMPPVPAIPDACLRAYLNDDAEPATSRAPPVLGYNNPCPLENFTIPRKPVPGGGRVSDMYMSNKGRTPALRIGKKGEVKTAFDAVSDSGNSDEL